jgi:hypothetical protein
LEYVFAHAWQGITNQHNPACFVILSACAPSRPNSLLGKCCCTGESDQAAGSASTKFSVSSVKGKGRYDGMFDGERQERLGCSNW